MKLPRLFLGSEEAAPNKKGVNLDVPNENVLSLRKKTFKIEIDPEVIVKYIVDRKKIFTPLSILLVFVILFSISLTGKADVVNFYPKTCLGGWENTSGAEGQPSVPEQAAISDFTKSNAAFLDNRSAQIFCGDFSGDIPEDATPRALSVRFSLFVDDGTMDREANIQRPKIEDSINPVVAPTNSQEVDTQNSNTSSPGVLQIPAVDTQTQDSSAGTVGDIPVITPENLPSSTEELNQLNSDASTTPDQTTGSVPDTGSASGDGNSSSGGDAGSSTPSSNSGDSSGSDSSGPSGFLQMIANKAHAQEAPPSDAPSTETPAVSDIPVLDNPNPASSSDFSVSLDSPAASDTPVDIAPTSPDTAQVSNGEAAPLDNGNISEDNSASTSADNMNTVLESVVVPSAQDDLFKITYTLDGQSWDTLGTVKRGGWQNLEFEIPVNVIEASWEKLAHLQISVDALQTIDQFPKTYLDSMWISVEYQKTDPDPNPQPDFNSDKVLQDVRYDQYRIIKILRPTGKYQMWYAFIPDELRNVQNTPDGQLPIGVDVIKSGDESLQVIDSNTLPSDQVDIPGDATTTPASLDAIPVPAVDTSSHLQQKDVTSPSFFDTISNALGAEAVNGSNPEPQVVSSIEAIPSAEVTTSTSDLLIPSEQDTQSTNQENASNVSADKPTDLNSLKVPEWHWDLIANDDAIHPDYDFGVDGGVVVWIDKKMKAINGMLLFSQGMMSQSFDVSKRDTFIEYIGQGGERRRADFDISLNKFIFSDSTLK